MYIRVVGKEIDFFENRRIILFGCGSCGLRALEEFQKIKANIIGFSDNNKDLWGRLINEYEIISPKELCNYSETSIMITSTYDKEIEEQLIRMGITKYYHVKVGVLRETLPKKYFSHLLSANQTNTKIYKALNNENPFFIGRLGSVELECLVHYLFFSDINTGEKKEYPNNIKMMMSTNAGFFPTDDELLDKFCRLYLDGLKEMDIIWSMWFSRFEDMIYRRYFGEKMIAEYDATAFPLYFKCPWTMALEAKKVLVIHPFEESIMENYNKRKKLFNNKSFMPDFDLITLKSVQSIANSKTCHEDWFQALKYMETQIDKLEFDIALIGAGAYGLALGTHIKKNGKKAIHIGGMLQLYFGIKGKAWDKLNIYNEYWTSPRLSEIPEGYRNVEAGRYW